MRPLYLKDDRSKEYLQTFTFIYILFLFLFLFLLINRFSSINSFMNYVFIDLTCITYVEGVSNE